MNHCANIRGLMAEGRSLERQARERGANVFALHTWPRDLRLQALQNSRRQDELRQQAAEEFAALNGWRWTKRLFSAEMLARGGTHSSPGWCYDPRLFDHPLFFRELARPYRAAAIVGQPYDTKPDDAHAGAAKIGLVLHVPPKETASWHYPGWTRFFYFTRPEITSVQFLPEQMGGRE